MTNAQKPVGVIPARFQVDELHAGHHHLITHVQSLHDDVLIALGSRRGLPTVNDPLPHEVRVGMIRESYPDIGIERIFDHPLDNRSWSRDLDDLIVTRYPDRSVILYGSRDSFIPKYTGRYETCEIPAMQNVSGTQVRREITFPNTREGRQAMIYMATNREPIIYRTVDLGIVDRARNRALFIKKDVHDGMPSFMGGFDNKKGETDVEAMLRELGEELPGLDIGQPQFLDSVPIDDPRYHGTPDGVKTAFFRAEFLGGDFTAADDADGHQWITRMAIPGSVVPWHRPLGELLLTRWDR